MPSSVLTKSFAIVHMSIYPLSSNGLPCGRNNVFSLLLILPVLHNCCQWSNFNRNKSRERERERRDLKHVGKKHARDWFSMQGRNHYEHELSFQPINIISPQYEVRSIPLSTEH